MINSQTKESKMNKTQNSPCSFNSKWSVDNRPTFDGFYERSMTKDKSNNIDGYLEMLGDYFDGIAVFPTMSWPRPAYPFQWVAQSVLFDGYEDRFEGLGFTPLEAIRDLYRQLKEQSNE